MIRFEQTIDALNHVKSYHLALSQFYLDAIKNNPNEKVKIALHYLSDHEKKLAAELRTYESEAPTSVLNTWFQYANDQTLLQVPSTKQYEEVLTMDSIFSLATAQGDKLVSLYEDMFEQSENEKLKALFDNLRSMQVRMNRQLSMNINRMMDV